MAKKLFVGNLSFNATESDLHDLFAQVGQVDSCTIVTDRETGRSRGFGFVEMNDEEAEKAVGQFHGKDFQGRALTVNEARPMAKREGGGGFGGRRDSRGGSGGGGGFGGRRDRY